MTIRNGHFSTSETYKLTIAGGGGWQNVAKALARKLAVVPDEFDDINMWINSGESYVHVELTAFPDHPKRPVGGYAALYSNADVPADRGKIELLSAVR